MFDEEVIQDRAPTAGANGKQVNTGACLGTMPGRERSVRSLIMYPCTYVQLLCSMHSVWSDLWLGLQHQVPVAMLVWYQR
jgi:hypothetical protein